jgi:lipoprotein-anchoring transpeptidase ErfK/SrfK
MKPQTIISLIICLCLLLPIGTIKASNPDADQDGLNDWQEDNFYKTDSKKADTDGDGYSDSLEIRYGYSPHNNQPGKKHAKKIEIDLKKQELSYRFDGKLINSWRISSGKASMPTPKGDFKVINKFPRPWSKRYGLWMPYWLGFKDGSYGLHELPEWSGGYKEGANHLGKPVSHGCVRLAVGNAKVLYDWAEIGTPIIIR